jgi:FKBP-type peptidyl-prolyl cis-trans isomerase
MIFCLDLKQAGIAVKYDEFFKGFRDFLDGKETRLSEDDALSMFQVALNEAIARRREADREKEAVFFAENGAKSGVVTTPSGLQYEIILEASGPKPGMNSMVLVNYEGSFMDGTVFDSSYARGEPAALPLDRVFPGWSEGIQLMSPGSTYRLFIPSVLAYGERGADNVIPPNTALIFKVELLSILPEQAETP